MRATLNVRRLLAAACFVVAQGCAWAQPAGAVSKFELATPGGAVALNPDDPNAPLGALPALTGQAWQHWMLPEISLTIVSRLRQTYSARIFVVNVGTSSVTAAVECLNGGNGRRMLRTNLSVKSRRQVSVNYAGGWCRVSGDGPVVVWATKFSSVSQFSHKNPNPPKPDSQFADETNMFSEVIPAYPYPADK